MPIPNPRMARTVLSLALLLAISPHPLHGQTPALPAAPRTEPAQRALDLLFRVEEAVEGLTRLATHGVPTSPSGDWVPATDADYAFDDSGHLGSPRVRRADGVTWVPRPTEGATQNHAPDEDLAVWREAISIARNLLELGHPEPAWIALHGFVARRRDADFEALKTTQTGPIPMSLGDARVRALESRLRQISGVLGQSLPTPLRREDCLGILLPPFP